MLFPLANLFAKDSLPQDNFSTSPFKLAAFFNLYVATEIYILYAKDFRINLQKKF